MPNHRELLTQIFCDVLENFAFMFGDPVEIEDLPPSDSGFLEARMTFRGKAHGTLVLAVSSGVVTEIAASILGTEPDDEATAGRARDALKEVLNVTCGHVLSALAGEEAFDLTPPTVTDLDEAGWSAHLADPDVATFSIEDNPAILRLIL